MKKPRSQIWFGLAFATLTAALGALQVLGTSHGISLEFSAMNVERQVFVTQNMEGFNTIRAELVGSDYSRKPLLINHLHVGGPEREDTRQLLTIERIVTWTQNRCAGASIPVGPSGNVLRAIAEASDGRCAGTVVRGGPLNSEFVLPGRGSVSVQFTSRGEDHEDVLIGVLAPVGSQVRIVAT